MAADAAARRSKFPTPSATPIRTCTGCGVRAAKSELLRLVVAGDEIVPDITARLPGRGAYLHPSLECLERAQRRRAFPRALRRQAPLPVDKLVEYLAARTGQ